MGAKAAFASYLELVSEADWAIVRRHVMKIRPSMKSELFDRMIMLCDFVAAKIGLAA
jgi:hypothetical protein